MTPNLKYMTLKNRCEIEKIQNNLSLYTTGSGFFDKVFKPDYSELLFFESWNMFSEETYSLFLNFLSQIDEQDAFMVTEGFPNYNIDQYLDFLKKEDFGNSKYFRAYKINKSFSYEKINEIQQEGCYEFMESYILSLSGNLILWKDMHMAN